MAGGPPQGGQGGQHRQSGASQSMYASPAPGTMMPYSLPAGMQPAEAFVYTAGVNDPGNVGFGKNVPTSLSTLAVGSPTGKEYYICTDVSQTTLYDNKEKLPPVPPLGHVYVWELAGWRMKDGSIKPISEATPQQRQTRPLWEAPPPMEDTPALPAAQEQSQNHGNSSRVGMFAPRPLPPVPGQGSQQAAAQQGDMGQVQSSVPLPWDQLPYPYVFPGAVTADVAGRQFTAEECQLYGVPLGTCWKDMPPQAGSTPAYPGEAEWNSSMLNNTIFIPPAPVFTTPVATAKSTVDEAYQPSTVQTQHDHSYHGPQPTANPDFLQTMWLQQQGAVGQGYSAGQGIYTSGYGIANSGGTYDSGYGISTSANTATQYNAGVAMTSMSTQFNGPYNGALSVGVGTEVSKGKYSYA